MKTNRRHTDPLPRESWRDRARREQAERARLIAESKRIGRRYKPDLSDLPV